MSSSHSRNSSRRGFRLKSANSTCANSTCDNNGFIPEPPSMVNQRGYYSDVVTKENATKNVLLVRTMVLISSLNTIL